MNINEFKLNVYEQFLDEQFNKEFKYLMGEQKELQEGYTAMVNWLKVEEKILNETTTDLTGTNALDTFKDIFKLGLELGKSGSQQSPVYNPEISRVDVKKLSTNNSIIENLTLFLGSIVKWIKNIAIKLIDIFSKSLRGLVGLENPKNKISPEDLKLKFEKVKKIENKYMVDYQDHKSKLKFDNISQKDMEDLEVVLGSLKGNVMVSESSLNENERTTFRDISINKIDVSDELMNLKSKLTHFFDIFDNSIGSNDEMLFGSDDLELLLNMTKRTFDDIKSYAGDVKFAIGGKAVSVDVISSDRMKDNLVRTKINTDNLGKAFKECNNLISDILSSMNTKQYIRNVTGMEISMITSATYNQLINILKVVNVREKEAEQLYKKMDKMKTKFEKLYKEIENVRYKFAQLGSNIAFTSALQQRISDLFLSAKYMTQTVALRFNSLALYIKELRQVKNLIINVNSINATQSGQRSKLMKPSKSLFM